MSFGERLWQIVHKTDEPQGPINRKTMGFICFGIAAAIATLSAVFTDKSKPMIAPQQVQLPIGAGATQSSVAGAGNDVGGASAGHFTVGQGNLPGSQSGQPGQPGWGSQHGLGIPPNYRRGPDGRYYDVGGGVGETYETPVERQARVKREQEEQLDAELEKRATASQYDSSLAWSATAQQVPTQNAASGFPDTSGLGQQEKAAMLQLEELKAKAEKEAQASAVAPLQLPPQNPRVPVPARDGDRIPSVAAPSDQCCVLMEGTIIETLLENRLEGSFEGPVKVMVSNSVYSNSREHLVMPAGSEFLGSASSVSGFAQSRLAVHFHRLLLPGGHGISLDQFGGYKGLDQAGESGLRDQVNYHYLKIFGASMAVGILEALGQGLSAGTFSNNTDVNIRVGAGIGTEEAAFRILDKFLNIPPTVTIREGHRVKVWLSGDLRIPPFDQWPARKDQ